MGLFIPKGLDRIGPGGPDRMIADGEDGNRQCRESTKREVNGVDADTRHRLQDSKY